MLRGFYCTLVMLVALFRAASVSTSKREKPANLAGFSRFFIIGVVTIPGEASILVAAVFPTLQAMVLEEDAEMLVSDRDLLDW